MTLSMLLSTQQICYADAIDNYDSTQLAIDGMTIQH